MPRTRQKLATLDAVEEIARRVPGYKGYQELTQRREDDRRFRSSIAEHLAGEVGAAVEWVEVTDLKDNTYFALIYLQIGDREVTIDSRPSDAISLALRTKSPIWVAKKVLEASSVLQQMEEGKEQNLSNVSRDKWAEILEKMAPEDFKYKM